MNSSIENRGTSRAALRSESQHNRRSTVRITLGLVLPLAMLTPSMRSAAAEKSADGNDVLPVAADTNDRSGVSDPFSDKWKLQLGAGAVNEARYPGSRFTATYGAPIVSLSYGRYFFGGIPGGGAPAGLGAYLVRNEHWSVGVDVGGGGRKPRRASDDPILHGWGDIPGTVRGGMFARYNIDWLSVHGSVSVAGHNEGVVASLGADAEYHPTPRLTLSAGPEVTLVNGQYAMTFFGLDARQSQIAGIAPYRAKSGINFVGGSATARYMLTERWSVAAHVSYGRLQGDAANSPVTTDKTQRVYGAFVMYRFR